MISIVITAYNVEQYIEECINSALNQTYKDIEVVVVLDKPTDKTAKIVKRIAKDNDKINIVENKQNLGAGLSRRCGIQVSQGEYVLLLDGDDYLRENFIEELYNKAVETDADIVSGGIEVLEESGIRTITYYGNITTEGYDKVTKFWGEKIVFMNNKLIRKTLHYKIPYNHRRYIEDTPVIIPQLWLANKVVYIDNAGYVYRMRQSSLTHTTNIVKDVIYKGLCWCDLMAFFDKYDKEFFNHFPLKDYISNIIKTINNIKFTPEQVAPHATEWAELMIKLLNLVKIESINWK